MKNMFRIMMAGLLMLSLTACLGERVEVPPAHVGKVSTKDGYRPDIIGTSRFRLEWCWVNCDKLVLVNVADQTNTENLEIFMPQDKLKLKVAIRTNLTITDKKATESLFNSLAPTETQVEGEDAKYVSRISRDSIYKNYAQQIILTETREYLSQFSIAEVASSMEKVNADLSTRLAKSLKERSPFTVRFVGITDIQYPDIIVQAQENAAQRREMIEQENAQKEVDKVKLERQLNETRLQRLIDVEQAEADAEVDRTRAAAAVDPKVVTMRKLEIEKIKAEKWNGQLPRVVGDGGTGLLIDLREAQ